MDDPEKKTPESKRGELSEAREVMNRLCSLLIPFFFIFSLGGLAVFMKTTDCTLSFAVEIFGVLLIDLLLIMVWLLLFCYRRQHNVNYLITHTISLFLGGLVGIVGVIYFRYVMIHQKDL